MSTQFGYFYPLASLDCKIKKVYYYSIKSTAKTQLFFNFEKNTKKLLQNNKKVYKKSKKVGVWMLYAALVLF